MNDLRTPISYVTLLVSVAACDSRADENYQGTSLLHLQGRVVLADESAPESLVPAVAFMTPDGVEIIDVAVQGDFPSNFRMDLYEPPPPTAIIRDMRAEDPAEQGEYAIASITAAPPDHPSKLLFASSSEIWDKTIIPYDGCAGDPSCVRAESRCADDPDCAVVERWCLDNTRTECRTVGLPSCATFGWSGEPVEDELEEADCEPLFSEGNDSIYTYERAIEEFAGYAERHVIFWTRGGLPKTHWELAALGIEEDLAPGYSLVELGEEPPYDDSDDASGSSQEGGALVGSSDSSEDPGDSSLPVVCEAESERAPEAPLPRSCILDECVALFQAETFARYNERHGTSFRCLEEVWEVPADDVWETEMELFYISEKLAIAHGLSIAQLIGTKVIHDPKSKLSIRISKDVDPLIF